MPSCCSLDNFGYTSDTRKNIFQTVCIATTFAAITGVVMGVLGLYGVVSSSTALWSQVGLFGGVALLAGLTVAASNKVKSKVALVMAVITLLTLPVLFGSLGAMGVIHPYHMLWAATTMCGGIVAGSFLISTCGIGRDCIKN